MLTFCIRDTPPWWGGGGGGGGGWGVGGGGGPGVGVGADLNTLAFRRWSQSFTTLAVNRPPNSNTIPAGVVKQRLREDDGQRE